MQVKGNTNPPSPRKVEGMTLIELLTGMAIAVICLSLGIPSYRHLMDRQRTDTAVHGLTSYLASARATAITHHKITTVCPTNGTEPVCTDDGDWSHGWLMFLDADGNHQPDGTEDILRNEVAPLSGALTMRSSAGRPQVRYLPDGRSAGSNITVRVCAEQSLMGEVIVNNMGRIRAMRPNGSRPCRS